MEFCSFASGSSGNSYLVRTHETSILIDAGISGKKIFEALEKSGGVPDDIRGVLVSHGHIDHTRSLRVVAKKAGKADVYSTLGTWSEIRDRVPKERHIAVEAGEEFMVGDILVRPFATSHDADGSVGFSLLHGGKQISILTDTGVVDEAMFREILDADILVLEANHDENVLLVCRYPYPVKRRILGDRGHLSNEAAGLCLSRVMREKEKERIVLLAHLSKENNTPDMALQEVRNVLEEQGVGNDRRLRLDVITRDRISPIYIV